MSTNNIHAKRGRDGLAIIGRTIHDLRGIRFDEGEEGNEPSGDSTPDVEVLQAAIAERDNTIATLTADLASKDAEITKWKAANYDLLLQVPGTEDNTETDNQEDNTEDDLGDDFLYAKEED